MASLNNTATSTGANSSSRLRNATPANTDADARTNSTTTGTGGAAEPEPEPPRATQPAATYNVRDYQNPDAGAAQDLAKPSKGKSKAKGKAGEGEGQGEGRAKGDEDDGAHRCGNCDAPDAKSKCKGCGVGYYCNRECQKVRVQVVS